MRIQVSIITIGMNHLRYLQALLPSLYGEGRPKVSFEMIYVDNCSTDGSLEYVRDNYPEVTIIKNREPYGFAENNNRGAFASTGKYIAIINPDIVLQKGAIDELFTYAEEHPEAGILVPRLLNPDGTNQYAVRRFVTLKALWGRALSKGNDSADRKDVNDYLCKDMDVDKVQAVDWSIGAAFFIPRLLYAELSGFDQDYFLYMEDEDLCLRSWKNGRPVMYIPTAMMVHNHLRASSKIGKKMLMHMNSLITYFRKHGISVENKYMNLSDDKLTNVIGGGKNREELREFIFLPSAAYEGRRAAA